jgi:hypothetical protein
VVEKLDRNLGKIGGEGRRKWGTFRSQGFQIWKKWAKRRLGLSRKEEKKTFYTAKRRWAWTKFFYFN